MYSEGHKTAFITIKEDDMALKLFAKPVETEVEVVEAPSAQDQRVAKMEKNLNELGVEVVRLRQEVNTLMARQQTYRVALKRLREYLEQRGGEGRSSRESSRSEQDEAEDEVPAAIEAPKAVKSKDFLH